MYFFGICLLRSTQAQLITLCSGNWTILNNCEVSNLQQYENISWHYTS